MDCVGSYLTAPFNLFSGGEPMFSRADLESKHDPNCKNLKLEKPMRIHTYYIGSEMHYSFLHESEEPRGPCFAFLNSRWGIESSVDIPIWGSCVDPQSSIFPEMIMEDIGPDGITSQQCPRFTENLRGAHLAESKRKEIEEVITKYKVEIAALKKELSTIKNDTNSPSTVSKTPTAAVSHAPPMVPKMSPPRYYLTDMYSSSTELLEMSPSLPDVRLHRRPRRAYIYPSPSAPELTEFIFPPLKFPTCANIKLAPSTASKLVQTDLSLITAPELVSKPRIHPQLTTRSYFLSKSLCKHSNLKTIVEDEEIDFTEEFSKPIPTLSTLSLIPREQGGKVLEAKESTIVVSPYSFLAPSQSASQEPTEVSDMTSEPDAEQLPAEVTESEPLEELSSEAESIDTVSSEPEQQLTVALVEEQLSTETDSPIIESVLEEQLSSEVVEESKPEEQLLTETVSTTIDSEPEEQTSSDAVEESKPEAANQIIESVLSETEEELSSEVVEESKPEEQLSTETDSPIIESVLEEQLSSEVVEESKPEAANQIIESVLSETEEQLSSEVVEESKPEEQLLTETVSTTIDSEPEEQTSSDAVEESKPEAANQTIESVLSETEEQLSSEVVEESKPEEQLLTETVSTTIDSEPEEQTSSEVVEESKPEAANQIIESVLSETEEQLSSEVVEECVTSKPEEYPEAVNQTIDTVASEQLEELSKKIESNDVDSEPKEQLSNETIIGSDVVFLKPLEELTTESEDETNSPSTPTEEVKTETPGLFPVGRPLCFDRESYLKNMITLDPACRCTWCKVHIFGETVDVPISAVGEGCWYKKQDMDNLPNRRTPSHTSSSKKKANRGQTNGKTMPTSSSSASLECSNRLSDEFSTQHLASRGLYLSPQDPQRKYSDATKTESPLSRSFRADNPPTHTNSGARGQGQSRRRGRGRGAGSSRSTNSTSSFRGSFTDHFPGLPNRKALHAKSAVNIGKRASGPTSLTWPVNSSDKLTDSQSKNGRSQNWSVSDSNVPKKRSWRGGRSKNERRGGSTRNFNSSI